MGTKIRGTQSPPCQSIVLHPMDVHAAVVTKCKHVYWNEKCSISTLEYIIASGHNHTRCVGHLLLWFGWKIPVTGSPTRTLKCPRQSIQRDLMQTVLDLVPG